MFYKIIRDYIFLLTQNYILYNLVEYWMLQYKKQYRGNVDENYTENIPVNQLESFLMKSLIMVSLQIFQ